MYICRLIMLYSENYSTTHRELKTRALLRPCREGTLIIGLGERILPPICVSCCKTP